MIAKIREEPYQEVKQKIETLIDVSNDPDDLKLVGVMKYIVPEFISKSSKYEALDKNKFVGKAEKLDDENGALNKAT
jgi:hypothetical protein